MASSILRMFQMPSPSHSVYLGHSVVCLLHYLTLVLPCPPFFFLPHWLRSFCYPRSEQFGKPLETAIRELTTVAQLQELRRRDDLRHELLYTTDALPEPLTTLPTTAAKHKAVQFWHEVQLYVDSRCRITTWNGYFLAHCLSHTHMHARSHTHTCTHIRTLTHPPRRTPPPTNAHTSPALLIVSILTPD